MAEGRPPFHRINQGRHDTFAIFEADGVDVVAFERRGKRGGRVAADQDEHPRRRPPYLASRLANAVVLQRMQTGDPDEAGPHPTHPGFEAGSKTEVRHRRLMAAVAEGRADVFEPKRLDAEERSETKPLIPGVGSQEEYPHVALPCEACHPLARRLLCKTRRWVGGIWQRIP